MSGTPLGADMPDHTGKFACGATGARVKSANLIPMRRKGNVRPRDADIKIMKAIIFLLVLAGLFTLVLSQQSQLGIAPERQPGKLERR